MNINFKQKLRDWNTLKTLRSNGSKVYKCENLIQDVLSNYIESLLIQWQEMAFLNKNIVQR